VTYSRHASFHDIYATWERGPLPMTSQSIAGILAAIVACAVLVFAVAYGPLGQFGKPAKQAQPVQAAPAPPAPRGPVIKDVPN
jgi:hypothetical protein